MFSSLRTRTVIVAFIISIPILTAWSAYRGQSHGSYFQKNQLIQTVSGDFARFDVTMASLAGFNEGNMSYFNGETYLEAVTRWIPFRSFGFTGGTMGMAKALNSSYDYSKGSHLATPIVAESYFNFGIFGVIITLLLVGWVVAVLDSYAKSGGVLALLFCFSIALKLPIGVALDISLYRIVYAVGFPFALALGLKWISDQRARNRQVPGTAFRNKW